jgi:hypothetical protein
MRASAAFVVASMAGAIAITRPGTSARHNIGNDRHLLSDPHLRQLAGRQVRGQFHLIEVRNLEDRLRRGAVNLLADAHEPLDDDAGDGRGDSRAGELKSDRVERGLGFLEPGLSACKLGAGVLDLLGGGDPALEEPLGARQVQPRVLSLAALAGSLPGTWSSMAWDRSVRSGLAHGVAFATRPRRGPTRRADSHHSGEPQSCGVGMGDVGARPCVSPCRGTSAPRLRRRAPGRRSTARRSGTPRPRHGIVVQACMDAPMISEVGNRRLQFDCDCGMRLMSRKLRASRQDSSEPSGIAFLGQAGSP